MRRPGQAGNVGSPDVAQRTIKTITAKATMTFTTSPIPVGSENSMRIENDQRSRRE